VLELGPGGYHSSLDLREKAGLASSAERTATVAVSWEKKRRVFLYPGTQGGKLLTFSPQEKGPRRL